MAISIKAPYQAYFASTESELKASCIKTGTLDRVYLETELVDATIDGEQHYSIPAIIHTDYGCRAKKNEAIPSVGEELFERATTIIPFRYEAEYNTWNGTTWVGPFEAEEPKATFVVTIDEEGNDRVLAYIQPQVYFTDGPTWFNYLAPPSLRAFFLIKTRAADETNTITYLYHLADVNTGDTAEIPNSGYTGTYRAKNMTSLSGIAYYLTNSRQYILNNLRSSMSITAGFQQAVVDRRNKAGGLQEMVILGACQCVYDSCAAQDVNNGWGPPPPPQSAEGLCYSSSFEGGEADAEVPALSIPWAAEVAEGYTGASAQMGSMLFGMPGHRVYIWPDGVTTTVITTSGQGSGDGRWQYSESATITIGDHQSSYSGFFDELISGEALGAYGRDTLSIYDTHFFDFDGLLYFGTPSVGIIELLSRRIEVEDGQNMPITMSYSYTAIPKSSDTENLPL